MVWLEMLTEGLLFTMIVFAPWAFGTTQPWSMWCMNSAAYVLAGMLGAKLWLRRKLALGWPNSASTRRLDLPLMALTIFILGYVLIAAVNAEFTYVGSEWRQEPHSHVKWLPHSLDRMASWGVFWNWLALACVFWAVHDHLAGDVAMEGSRRPRRLHRLLFVLAGNAALVAFEGILQRSSGTPKLLWFMPTHDNPMASAQFGPYAYRSNAAQFFNLVWPLALGVWWQRHLQSSRRAQHHWLLPCVMVLLAGSLVSLSRAGAGVAILQLLACICVVIASSGFSARSRLAVVLVFVAAVGAASYLGWEQLFERLRSSAADPLSGRRETYELAERMTKDYPWFGVGPGAFGSVFQFYRNSTADYWPGQLHNDWLEYLITFGRIGCALLVTASALIAGRWFTTGGLRTHWTFTAFIWVALGGCLLHARVDFPLQIYSIQFVFIVLCAILFSISRQEPNRRA